MKMVKESLASARIHKMTTRELGDGRLRFRLALFILINAAVLCGVFYPVMDMLRHLEAPWVETSWKWLPYTASLFCLSAVSLLSLPTRKRTARMAYAVASAIVVILVIYDKSAGLMTAISASQEPINELAAKPELWLSALGLLKWVVLWLVEIWILWKSNLAKWFVE